MSGHNPTSKRICHRSEPAGVVRQRTITMEAREFVIDGQKIGRRVLFHGSSCLFNSCDYVGDDLWVYTTKRPIDLDVAVVTIWREANQLVGAEQTSKTALIGAARRQTLGFIDDQAREIAAILQ